MLLIFKYWSFGIRLRALLSRRTSAYKTIGMRRMRSGNGRQRRFTGQFLHNKICFVFFCFKNVLKNNLLSNCAC